MIQKVAFFILFDLPSILLITLHKIITEARGRYWEPVNIWFYRIGGLFLAGFVIAAVVGASA